MAIIDISNKQRASLVGALIFIAYSVLTYAITDNIMLGVITDIISGFAVIGIPLLMYKLFSTYQNIEINVVYMAARFIEGILMIVGGVIIIIPELESYRAFIYSDIHIYFFISGALLFYVLLYRTLIIPKFISVWGIIATLMLFAVTIIKQFGIELEVLNILVIPIILNELFLAVWLIAKGFRNP